MKNVTAKLLSVITLLEIILIFLEVGVPNSVSKLFWILIVICINFMVGVIENKFKISSFSQKKSFLVLLISISLFSLFFYVKKTEDLIIHHPYYEEVFFPITSKGDLQFMISNAGGRYEAIDMFGRDQIVQEILKNHKLELVKSSLLLISIFQMIFIPIILLTNTLVTRTQLKHFPNKEKRADFEVELENIREMIERNDTNGAIVRLKRLIKIINNDKFLDELTIVSARFNKVKKDYILGLQNDDVLMNQINHSLLMFIDELKEYCSQQRL